MQSCSPLFALEEEPLCLLASPGSCIYVIYPKLIITYTQSFKTAEFILSEPVKKWAIHNYYLFLLYQSNKLERRDLLSWQDVIELGDFSKQEVKWIKAHSQRRVMVIFQRYFSVIEVANSKPTIKKIAFDSQLSIKDVCCEFQNHEKTVNLCFVMESSNKILKYSMHEIGTVLHEVLTLSNEEILYMDILKYPLSSILYSYSPQFLLTVSSRMDISLFNIFDTGFIPKLQFNLKELAKSPLPKPALTVDLHYNPEQRTLYIQINKTLYAILFKSKLSPLPTPTIMEYIQGCQIHQNVQGRLECSNKEGAVIKSNLNVYQIKDRKVEEHQQIVDIIREKQKIAEELMGYSRQAREKIKWEDGIEAKVDSPAEQLKEDNFQLLEQAKYLPETESPIKEPEVIQESQKPIQTPISNQPPVNPPIEVQASPKVIPVESNLEFPQEQPPKGVQVSIQTQEEYPNLDFSQIEQEVELRISKFTDILQQQISTFYDKTQLQLSTFRQTISNMIQESLRSQISVEVKQYMSQLFAPKLQKYLSITFHKLNEMIEAGNTYNLQQISKEQIKYSQINKHIIERNKEFMQKVLEILRSSINKFDQKKQEMAASFEAKFNLLNDLVLQAEQLTRKFELRMKQENAGAFERKIYDLLGSLQEGAKSIRKVEQEIGLPPVIQSNLSHISQVSQTVPAQYHQPQYPVFHPQPVLSHPLPQQIPHQMPSYQAYPPNYPYIPPPYYGYQQQYPPPVGQSYPQNYPPNYPPSNQSYQSSYGPGVPSQARMQVSQLQHQLSQSSQMMNQSHMMKHSSQSLMKPKMNN